MKSNWRWLRIKILRIERNKNNTFGTISTVALHPMYKSKQKRSQINRPTKVESLPGKIIDNRLFCNFWTVRTIIQPQKAIDSALKLFYPLHLFCKLSS